MSAGATSFREIPPADREHQLAVERRAPFRDDRLAQADGAQRVRDRELVHAPSSRHRSGVSPQRERESLHLGRERPARRGERRDDMLDSRLVEHPRDDEAARLVRAGPDLEQVGAVRRVDARDPRAEVVAAVEVCDRARLDPERLIERAGDRGAGERRRVVEANCR